MKSRLWISALIALTGITLAGCGGGGAELRSEVINVSTGQQLMDLKRALESGAMTKYEYEQEREKILNKN
jgi:hypothetical protein